MIKTDLKNIRKYSHKFNCSEVFNNQTYTANHCCPFNGPFSSTEHPFSGTNGESDLPLKFDETFIKVRKILLTSSTLHVAGKQIPNCIDIAFNMGDDLMKKLRGTLAKQYFPTIVSSSDKGILSLIHSS